MKQINKSIGIENARISFVSLVDKAANHQKFLIVKAEEGETAFAGTGIILKVDDVAHYITGIVYEPMKKDAHDNYMTEEEIKKAAYWYSKHGDQVDVQHSFQSANGVSVVESYVAPCELEIGGQLVVKGTWVMTVEVTNEEIWGAVKKGEITGFSMGGVGTYSKEDVNLDGMEKSEIKKSVMQKLAEALGVKEEPVEKAGKSLSGKNKTKLKEICNALNGFLADFPEDEEEKGTAKTPADPKEQGTEEKKVVKELDEERVQELVNKSLSAVAPSFAEVVAEAVCKRLEPTEQEVLDGQDLEEQIRQAVDKALEPMRKQFSLATNLGDEEGSGVQKSAHYLHGIL